MIRLTEEPAPDTMPEPVVAGYRLEGSPRREGGSCLFAATAADGSPATLQISAEPVPNRRARARFRRLAGARAELEHPALLGVREIGEEGGRVFVASERFPERSLADMLRNGPLEPNLALRLLRAAADGLDAAHAVGLVHRTLSAESVLLEGDGVKLDLFGVFTAVGPSGWGDVVRRDAHMQYESPEAVRGDELGPLSNVYSLAALLFHTLTGQQPFAHHDPVMITYAHISQPPPKPSELKPELPEGLDGILARGMAKAPGERPDSAGGLIAGAALVLRTASSATSGPVSRGLTSPKAAPAPTRVLHAPVAPVPPAEPSAPWRPPLKARLAPWAPLLLVVVVAALFGALLGMPGASSQERAGTARSAEEHAVERLGNIRFRLRDGLAFASTADEQADVAGRLATAYGHAADDLTASELASAANRASAAYVSLERAARAADEDAYESASGSVEAAESKIDSRLSSVRRERRRD